LYWKKGTTLAAWCSIIIGSSIAVTGMILQQAWPAIYGNQARFPINSQWIYFIAMVCSVLIYVIISLVQNQNFNLDKMLHRGKYSIAEDNIKLQNFKTNRFFKTFGITAEFSLTDKIIFFSAMAYSLGWWCIFIIGCLLNIIKDVPSSSWMSFWHFKIIFDLILGIIVTIWFTTGGVKDLFNMFKTLKSKRFDINDDGIVRATTSVPKSELNLTTVEK
jgi:SSS family solute:Na+ symporter